jgi:hypothetical protein
MALWMRGGFAFGEIKRSRAFSTTGSRDFQKDCGFTREKYDEVWVKKASVSFDSPCFFWERGWEEAGMVDWVSVRLRDVYERGDFGKVEDR